MGVSVGWDAVAVVVWVGGAGHRVVDTAGLRDCGRSSNELVSLLITSVNAAAPCAVCVVSCVVDQHRLCSPRWRCGLLC